MSLSTHQYPERGNERKGRVIWERHLLVCLDQLQIDKLQITNCQYGKFYLKSWEADSERCEEKRWFCTKFEKQSWNLIWELLAVVSMFRSGSCKLYQCFSNVVPMFRSGREPVVPMFFQCNTTLLLCQCSDREGGRCADVFQCCANVQIGEGAASCFANAIKLAAGSPSWL